MSEMRPKAMAMQEIPCAMPLAGGSRRYSGNSFKNNQTVCC